MDHAVGDVACWVRIALGQRRPPLRKWVAPDYQAAAAAAVVVVAAVVVAVVVALSADVGAEE